MTSRYVFPGPGQIPVDARIVAPESRAEILGGRLILSPPAQEGHAVPHAGLAYVLSAHCTAAYTVAIDLLTRTSADGDFAPDASVFPRERDPVTGGRKLEELAFEIVSEQAVSVQTDKARELVARGVRRVFCLVAKQRKLLEWSRATDAWSATPIDAIDDPCFVRPLPAAALLDATLADDAVMKALRAKGHPEFAAERALGVKEGREGEARDAVKDMCEALGVEVDAARAERLAAMDLEDLRALRAALKKTRRWPD